MSSSELQTQSKALGQPAGVPKMYVMDDNSEWVDFSSVISGSLQDRLVSIEQVKHSVEKRVGVFNTSVSSVTLRNEDGFFSKPLLSQPKFKTVKGADALFSATARYGRTAFYRHKVKLAFQRPNLSALNAYEEITLGVFLWDTATYSSSSNTVQVKLKALSDALRDIPADSVTDGLSWYQAKPSWFLIEELTKKAFRDINGNLPAEYRIELPIQIDTFDGALTLSAYGRCGDYAKASGESSYTWKYPTSICRAIVYGTVGSEAGVWLGLDDSVYMFDPTTEKYTEKVTATDLGAGYKVVWLKVVGAVLWGVAVVDQANSTNSNEFSVIGQAAKIFTFDGTAFTVRQTETNLWTGFWAARTIGITNGFADYNCVGQLDDAGGGNGEGNGQALTVPFTQRVYFKNTRTSEHSGYKSPWYTNDTGATPSATFTNLKSADMLTDFGDTDLANITTPQGGRPGFWIISPCDVGGFVLFSLNSQGCFVTHNLNDDTPTGYLFYFVAQTDDQTTDAGRTTTWRLKRIKLTSPYTVTAQSPDFTMNDATGGVFTARSRPGFPIAMAADLLSNGRLWVSSFNSSWGLRSSLGGFDAALRDSNTLWQLDNATTGVTVTKKQFDNAENSGSWAFVPDLVATPSSEGTAGSMWKIVELVWFNSHLVASAYSCTTGDWCIIKDVETATPALIEIISRSLFQAKGFVEHVGFSDYLYFYEVGTGRIGRVDTSWNVTYISNGDPAVTDDSNLSVGLTTQGNGDPPIFWGVSAPFYRPETQFGTPVGKYHLFKAAVVVTDRVELADFSDMNCWDAISAIAEAMGCVVGFDVNGSLFYRKRVSASAVSDYTLVHGAPVEGMNEYPIDSVEVSSGEEDVFNFVEIAPSTAAVLDPSFELRLRKRTRQEQGTTSDSQPAFLDFYPDVRSTLRQTLKLVCAKAGDLNDADSKHYIRFRFQVIKRIVEARLVQNYTGGTTVSLASVFGGAGSDDGIHVGDFAVAVNPSDEGQELIRATTAVSISANTIIISSAFGVNLNKGDIIKILKKNQTSSAYASADWSDDGVTYITEATGTDNVVRVNSVENLAVGMVVQIGYDELRISAIDETVSPPAITVYSVDEAAQNFSASHVSGTVVRAWIAPNALDKFFAIGKSGVFLKFVKPASGTVDTKFVLGDVITIVAPGLELQEDEHAKQTVVSLDSVRDFGRKDYPTLSNPFLSRSLARNLAYTLVSIFKDPTFDIQVDIKLGLDIAITTTTGLSRIDVRAQYVFPQQGYYDGSTTKPFTVQCILREISHDVRAGRSRLRLKAVRPY